MKLATYALTTCVMLGAWSTRAHAESGHLALDTGFHTQDMVTATALVLDGGFRPTDTLELTLVVPLAFGSVDFPSSSFFAVEDGSGTGVGNLILGAHYVFGDQQSPLRGRVGGQIGIPTANSSDDFPDTFVRAYAAMTYGMRNLWWYAVDFVPIVLSFDVEHQAGSLFVLADAAMGALVPIRDRADLNGGTDAVLQLRAGLAYGSDAVNGGLKLGLVQGVIDSPGDQTQLAAEPFLRLSFSDAVYAEASLTINLDEPLGFAFDDQKIWGLHFGLGVRF